MKKKILLSLSALSLLFFSAQAQVITVYEENFESGWPGGIAWPDVDNPSGEYWQVGDAATWSSTNFIIPDHTNFMVVNDDGWDADNSYSYATPTESVDLPDVDNLKLTFDLYFEGNEYDGNVEACELYLYDNTTDDLNEILFTGSTEWQSLEFDLDAYRGHNIYFSITYFDQGSWLWGVAADNFKISYSVPITVTYQVDVTNYLAAGNLIDPTGIRVAGNFGDFGATSGGNNMLNWNPTDVASGMAYLGSNIWSIQVIYPGESEGQSQYYKFVNGDWGMNEGTDPENTIAIDGCGVDDGGGNINRLLNIPATSTLYTYCWDRCEANCPVIEATDDMFAVSGLTVFPNPAKDNISVQYQLPVAGYVNIHITDLQGNDVYVREGVAASAGYNVFQCGLQNISSGLYLLHIDSHGAIRTQSFVVE
ncbi:MAG: T9SS type A sorting domain-containing protein [Chitinophagales bacterium]